jgi:hypothetical protein
MKLESVTSFNHRQYIQQYIFCIEFYLEIMLTKPHMNYGKEDQQMSNTSEYLEVNVI